MIIIEEHGDLIVRVTETIRTYRKNRSVVGVEEFRVCRRTLIDASPIWKGMLESSTRSEGSQSIVEFYNDPLKSAEILFMVLHDTVIESTYEVPIKEIW